MGRQSTEFQSVWIDRLQQPETREQAARVIYEHFSDQLLMLLRQQLSARFAGRVDPEDILQSVFRSFFRKPFELQDARGLFALLVQLCLNKTRTAVRFHSSDKRDVRREKGGEAGPQPTNGIGHSLQQRRASSEPVNPEQFDQQIDAFFDEETLQLMAVGATAEQAAVLFEMVTSLPDDLQPILNWRLEGLTETEIAERMSVTRRTVTRKLARIYEHLQLHQT